MVCTKCEKKLRKGGPAPDPWKEGSSNDKRKVNENKLLSKSRRFQPYQQKCKTCKSTLHEPQAQYCQSCAYSKGICHICGTQILDTSGYKQSAK
ncbi:probable cysteine-rich PDZ-binding protein [Coccomyxa sp. Obi]|nr:probable cysteine-rich PDZ-binding protein [Coccomyxa sp. Obi]